MRRRLLSAVVFVAVLRCFPSHREITTGLRHLLYPYRPVMVTVPVAAHKK